MQITPELLRRFYSRVHRRTIRRGSCWIWTGAKQNKPNLPYGLFWVTPRARIVAHKFSYIVHHGPLAPGKVIGHRCNTPLCVNPDHLRAITQVQNVHESINSGRRLKAKAPHLFSLPVYHNFLKGA